MASTTWSPLERTTKRSWLLTDGTVLDEPALEVSGSYRRVRLAAVPKLSGSYSNLTPFLDEAAQTYAETQGKKVWMPLGTCTTNNGTIGSPIDQNHLISSKINDFQTPYFLSPSGTKNTLAWRFTHETMPIEAELQVKVERSYRSWSVTSKFRFPGTWPGDAMTSHMRMLSLESNIYNQLVNNAAVYGDCAEATRNWAQANPVDWLEGIPVGKEVEFQTEREALAEMARLVRLIDDLDEIDIPNLVDLNSDGTGTITKLTLKRHRVNFDATFIESLTDYLSGESVVEQIKTKWNELVLLFRSVGLIVEDPKESQWWQLLVNGSDGDPVEVVFDNQEVNDDRGRKRHAVKVNLATGSVVVACSETASKDETAVQYETSLIKAKLSGKEDEFLAYARAYADGRITEQANSLMEQSIAAAAPSTGTID